jgi:hypothetical protein
MLQIVPHLLQTIDQTLADKRAQAAWDQTLKTIMILFIMTLTTYCIVRLLNHFLRK